MELTDEEVAKQLQLLISKIYSEGRITEKEANMLAILGLYNNSTCTRPGKHHKPKINS